MKGLTPFLVLLATKLGFSAGHAVNVLQDDGRRALSAVEEAGVEQTNDLDLFYRRLDPEPGQCCGMCTQLTLNTEIVVLLISGDNANAGDLNPAVLGAAANVNIIIRMTIIYTDNTAADPSIQETIVFDVLVVPGDWTREPCSYIENDCVVFQNEDLFMFAPDSPGPGGFATLSLDAVNEFNADTDVNIISTRCTLVCENASECDDPELDPAGNGIDFGVIQQSQFNNGFCDPTIWDDPHLTGLRGQRFDWSGKDGGWYAFLSTPDQLQMNLRVTSHLPTTFPERQLVTGVALVTEGGHMIVADIAEPLNLAPACESTADAVGSAPCLINGGLRATVDGREQMQRAGEYHFDGDIHITAVNLPLECQRFGDYMMWGNLDKEQRLRGGSRSLRSVEKVTSIFEWLLADTVMIAPPWCERYLRQLNGDVNALANIESTHAVLRIDTPNISLRVNVGINTEHEQTLKDGRVVPTASFWQMDVRVEYAEGIETAKGMLGETARPVRDRQTGKKVMSGPGILRGRVEDYQVVHPLGTEFKQRFVPEE